MNINISRKFLVLALFLAPNVAHADLSLWLFNIAAQVPEVLRVVVAVGYIAGIWFVVAGISKFKMCAQGTTMMSQHYAISGPLVYLFVGVALIYFAGFIRIGSTTVFGQGSAIAYQATAPGNGTFTSVFVPIVTIIRLMGYIAFMRGFFILARLGGQSAQQGTLGKGLVHIFGGILAINIEATYIVLMNSLTGGIGWV